MEKINGTYFDLDYCMQFSESHLRQIYNGESAETLDLLIEKLKPEVSEVSEKKSKKDII